MAIGTSVKCLAFSLLLCLAAGEASAQAVAAPEEYKFDIGVGAGVSGYLGDANETALFGDPGVAFNASFRYLANARLAIRGLFTVNSLAGNTADMENVLPLGQPVEFHSTVYGLECRGEFNFFNYGIGESYKQMRRWTPYLALGVGVGLASTGDGTYAALSLPMAAGIKFKARPRLNLGLEFCMTKLFTDKADADALADPYHIKSSFLKNTDWTSSVVFSISYEFGRRCVACNRLD